MYNISVLKKGTHGMQNQEISLYSFVILSESLTKADYINSSIQSIHPQKTSIQIFKEITQLEAAINQLTVFSIFILDMNHNSKIIDLTKTIHMKFPFSQIIITSDFLEDALYVFDTECCYFIHYAEWNTFIKSALHKAECKLMEHQHHIKIIMKDKIVLLPIKEIQYLERVKRMTYIHASQLYHDARNLTFHMQRLNWLFVQCHRSFIINLSYVREYHRDKFILQDGSEIPISRPFSKNVKLAFEQYSSLC